MPQLHHNFAASGVHIVGHFLPRIQLLGAVQARHVGIALALLGNGGGLGDDQARRSALGIVSGRKWAGYRIWRAVARQRRHHDAVGQVQVTSGDGVK